MNDVIYALIRPFAAIIGIVAIVIWLACDFVVYVVKGKKVSEYFLPGMK